MKLYLIVVLLTQFHCASEKLTEPRLNCFSIKEVTEEPETCSICLKFFEENHETRTTQCNHQFHSECFYKWIFAETLKCGEFLRYKGAKNLVCPTCGGDISNIRSAAWNGDNANIQSFLEQGTDVNEADEEYGWTALHFAVRRSHLSTVNFLLKKGANENAADTDGNIPLHYAALKGSEGGAGACILKNLIAKNPESVNARSKHAVTPLMFAAMRGHTEIVHILLENGPNLETVDLHYGLSALHWAADGNYKSIVKVLLAKNAKVNTLDDYGQTPLIYASWRGNADVVQILLKNGANKSLKNRNGKTALDVAYNYDCEAILRGASCLERKFSKLMSAIKSRLYFRSQKPKVEKV